MELPVRRVVLYKNGVGYFEHTGRVTGNQAITVDFTSSQLDDALQSLTALDLGGGRIAAVSYNSNTPFDQQLKNIPLGLDENPDTTDLYGALRGARVEVSGAGVTTGRILDYEARTEKTASGGETDRRFLTVVTDAGAVRTFEVTPATSVRVVDGDLRRDLDSYLGLLASTQTRQMRHLTLEANGTGTRDIRVSYISAVPVWKTTYRIVFPPAQTNATPSSSGSESAILQGWAVVDNTVGSDWDNVQLSLVAGAPQSFTEPLSQPIYTTRPSIPVPEAENIAPTIHEGALETAPQAIQLSRGVVGALKANRPVDSLHGAGSGGGIGSGSGNGIGPGSGAGFGSGSGGGFAGGIMRAAPAPPPPPVQDITASASSSAFDDYFEYTVAQPVTIHRNESALVPVLQTNVDAERVTLWNAGQPVPLRALWLSNSSKLTLDRGSFSIYENGEFAGEGITDPIHAGEKRLLSYAVDQAVHVSSEGQSFTSHLRHITVHDGYLTERTEQARNVTYVVHNTAADARTVIVEHPAQDGWKLTSDTKPVETTASLYRFQISVQPGETARLHVGQTHVESTRYQLTGLTDDQLQVIIHGSGDLPAIDQALAPVLTARAKLHEIETQIAQQDAEIERVEQDSTRLHNNIGGLKDSAEERALARRYAGEMNADEDQLQALRKHRTDLEQQRTAAQHALDEAIRQLDIDQDV